MREASKKMIDLSYELDEYEDLTREVGARFFELFDEFVSAASEQKKTFTETEEYFDEFDERLHLVEELLDDVRVIATFLKNVKTLDSLRVACVK
jgi:hypothetical protein